MSDLTFGQRLVGLEFNPSGEDIVNATKQNIATIIDSLDAVRSSTEDEVQKDLADFALKQLLVGQMCAVKAFTWGIKPRTISDEQAQATLDAS